MELAALGTELFNKLLNDLDLEIEDKGDYCLLRVIKPKRTIAIRVLKDQYYGYGPGDVDMFLALVKQQILGIDNFLHSGYDGNPISEELKFAYESGSPSEHPEVFPIFELGSNDGVLFVTLRDKVHKTEPSTFLVTADDDFAGIHEYNQYLSKALSPVKPN